MKVLLIVALFACVSLVAGDLVCGSSYCKQHPCPNPVSRSSCRVPSQYRAAHAGKCGCCPACVTLLNEGAVCKSYSKELGETPAAICKEPLLCIGGACRKIVPRK